MILKPVIPIVGDIVVSPLLSPPEEALGRSGGGGRLRLGRSWSTVKIRDLGKENGGSVTSKYTKREKFCKRLKMLSGSGEWGSLKKVTDTLA